jgi:hypothetical protein
MSESEHEFWISRAAEGWSLASARDGFIASFITRGEAVAAGHERARAATPSRVRVQTADGTIDEEVAFTAPEDGGVNPETELPALLEAEGRERDA